MVGASANVGVLMMKTVTIAGRLPRRLDDEVLVIERARDEHQVVGMVGIASRAHEGVFGAIVHHASCRRWECCR